MNKNAVIAVLGVLVAILAGVLLVERAPGIASALKFAPRGEPVRLVEVVLEREERRFVDLVFDHPLGEGKIGEVLGEDPVRLDPATGGAWTWQGGNVLRFEPSSGFALATRYALTLLPEKLLAPGQRLAGEARREFQTDAFLVEAANVVEEPAAEKAAVILRLDVRFNYRVDPKVLVGRMKLVDPANAGSPVKFAIETDWASPAIGVRTEPVAKLRAARTLTLTIAGTMTPMDGNVPLGRDWISEIPIGSNERLEVRGVRVEPGTDETTLRVELSSPVTPEAAAPFVSVSPKSAWRLASQANALLISGSFRHGETYRLELAKGLPGDDGSSLLEARREEVTIADLAPTLDFQSRGMFLSATGWRSLALETVNVDRARITVDRVYRNNLFVLFQYHGWDVGQESGWTDADESWDAEAGGERGSDLPNALGDRIARRVVPVTGERNKKTITSVRLDDLVRGEPGLYRIVAARKGAQETAVRWLLITDLGVVAKQGAADVFVWVSSFSDLKPVAGAEVRVLSDKNQTIARGTTDARGIFRQEGLAAVFEKQKPYLVTVERGGDFGFLLFNATAMDTAGLDVGGARAAGLAYDAFLYGERDLFRPGETARGLAVVRDRALLPPAPMPLVLRHKDPLGRELGTYTVTSGKQGSAAFEIPILPIARTGPHVVELLVAKDVVGRWRFQVEEFVPDRIQVALRTGQAAVAPGEPLAIDVQGDYLFGAPAAGLDVEARVRLRPAPFSPEGWEGWTFANDERAFAEREIASERAVLDEAGKAAFSVTIPPGLRPASGLEAEIVARAQESGGRGVAASRRVRVFPFPYFLGLKRAGEQATEPGRNVSIAWAAVAPDGAPARAGALRFEAFRDRWNTVLRRTPQGTWRYETTREPVPVESRALAGGATRGEVAFTPREFGSYRAVLTDVATGASSQVAVEAWGWGYASWAIKDPDRLEMTLDREEYRAGDTATVRIKAPFSGRLLLAVERDGVLAFSTHVVTGNTAEIALAVEESWRPNVHVTGVLVRAARDVEPGTAGRAFGAVPLLVDRLPHRIAVEVECAATTRPRGPLSVAVRAAPGAVVTVAAVDEGILQLVAQKTADPFGFFYRRLALGVRSHDTFALLLPEGPKRDRKAVAGGDAGLADGARMVRTEGIRRVEPVAFWSGPIEADAAGRAVAKFDLPEFQGALRVMAVAVKERSFGAADTVSRVRDPIVLLPTFPRVLAPGDAVVVPVLVRNDTGGAAPVRVRLAVQGAARVTGDASKTVKLKQGESATLLFEVQAGEAAGPVTLVFEGTGAQAASRATGKLAVRHDLPERVLAAGGRIESAVFEAPAEDTRNLRPGTLARDARVAPYPVVPLAGKLRELLRYPYGCLEQTTSAAFPLVYLGDLARELDPGAFELEAPALRVQEALRRLAAMQLPGGGFSMWPNGDTVAPWPSLWATHFLVEAKRAGFLVDGLLHERALVFAGGETRIAENTTQEAVLRAAYGHLALARAGKADRAGMDLLRRRHLDRLGAGGRALLGAALAATGDVRAARELLDGLEIVANDRRVANATFDSPVRDRALLLLALAEFAPGDARVARLAERLARDAGAASPWTTHESGWALLALGQLVRQQKVLGPYSGRLDVAGKSVGTFDAKPAAFRDLPAAGRLSFHMGPGYTPGAAYWAVLTRGVPRDEAYAAESAGLEIERAFLDRNGVPLDLAQLRQGDLVVARTRVRTTSGPVDNVVVANLLPAGLEVENPRLSTSESLPWVTGDVAPAWLEARDDRVLAFLDLRDAEWKTVFALLRAVHAGSFRLPPAHAEAMYDPARRASGERGALVVRERAR